MITIAPHAAARLALMIAEEPDADKLGIRLVPTTTGCGSFTYSIAITEAQADDFVLDISGIRFFYQPREVERLKGIMIDCDRETGRLSIIHPGPPQSDCPHTH